MLQSVGVITRFDKYHIGRRLLLGVYCHLPTNRISLYSIAVPDTRWTPVQWHTSTSDYPRTQAAPLMARTDIASARTTIGLDLYNNLADLAV